MQASRAAVRPRFISATTGDALSLEDSVLELFTHFRTGVVEITGPSGAGKTFALQHLAAVLPDGLALAFLRREEFSSAETFGFSAIIEVDVNSDPLPGQIARFDLAPWGTDEFIEYVLTRFPGHCKSVMKRLSSANDKHLLNGRPELCSITLDRMAADPAICSVSDALRADIIQLVDGNLSRLPEARELLTVTDTDRSAAPTRVVPPKLQRLLRHGPVRRLAAALQLAAAINCGDSSLLHRAQVSLCTEIASFLNADGIGYLRAELQRPETQKIHPVLASILLKLDPTWRPDRAIPRNLRGATLTRAKWSGLSLRCVELTGSDLRDAQLVRANLTLATAVATNFRRSSLRNAVFGRIHATGACFASCEMTGVLATNGSFRGADFSSANAAGGRFLRAIFTEADLTECSFHKAAMRQCEFHLANLTLTDFSDADLTAARLTNVSLQSTILTGTILERAVLDSSDLEFVELPNVRFRGASLATAVLTCSSMPDGDFRDTRLTNAYLAEIDWPGADLRDADLRGCTFHMGSSRSGLISSDLASEGSRTGFYANGYDDHLYKPPEGIRAANLRNADLRGANITGVDFYRVDLRGAKYDRKQRAQLTGTGAILE